MGGMRGVGAVGGMRGVGAVGGMSGVGAVGGMSGVGGVSGVRAMGAVRRVGGGDLTTAVAGACDACTPGQHGQRGRHYQRGGRHQFVFVEKSTFVGHQLLKLSFQISHNKLTFRSIYCFFREAGRGAAQEVIRARNSGSSSIFCNRCSTIAPCI
ncbi:MAG TPA: hypothetical protein ENN60_02965 [archaeon]|nr:hypothetical protein [archaeon]